MANFVPTSNFTGFVSLAAGEYALIAPGIVVGSAGTTITGSSGNVIDNQGSIVGGLNGVGLDSTSVLYNRDAGSIAGITYGVVVQGISNILDNSGSIFGGAFGLLSTLDATKTLINNSGSIVAGHQTISGHNAALEFITPGSATVVNSGLIKTMRAGSYAIRDFEGAGGAQTIINTGTIVGKIALNHGNDLINTAAGTVSGTIELGNGNDTAIGSARADTIFGGLNNDTLTGNAGNDRLDGGGNPDKLSGGLGIDTLTGGTGADLFIFNTAANTATNRDVIKDFSHADDTLQFENAVFTKLGNAGALNAQFLRLRAAPLDANDHLIYNKATGVLTYDVNGVAAGGAQQVAVLQNKPPLTLGDFVVI